MEIITLLYIYLGGVAMGFMSGKFAVSSTDKLYKARTATRWRIIKIHALHIAALVIAVTLHILSTWTIAAFVRLIT